MVKGDIWGFSGGSARAIGLFESANVCMKKSEKPMAMIGQSSGAIVVPIVAVAFQCPEIMEKALEFARALDVEDMFPFKGCKPFNKKGKPTPNAILRILTGRNYLGWQDIAPMFKKVFTEEYFEIFKKTDIDCYGFGVVGEDGTPQLINMNEAKSLEELIAMIEKTARIVPFVQSKEGMIDGGFISFCPSYWLFKKYSNIKTLISVYSKELTLGIEANDKWDKSILSIVTQTLLISTHWIAVKDALIEELYCENNNINYIRIECPNGYTDELYETDDSQLKALGIASRDEALKAFC